MAVIAGAELTLQKFDVQDVYTYGQPKVGEEELALFYQKDELLGRHIRFVNNKDIVPRVPPGCVHHGALKRFDSEGDLIENPQELFNEATSNDELSEVEFQKLQEEVKQLNDGSSELPPSDKDIEQHLFKPDQEGEGLFGLEKLASPFTDHKMKNYIRLVKAMNE